MNIKACEAWLNERTEGTFIAFVFISSYAHQFLKLSVLLYILYMVDGCTLSNSLVVIGVHNIPKERLLMELNMRRIPIPKRGTATSTGIACLATSDGEGYSWCKRCEVFQRAR
jgi:hypothetical protein